MTQQSGHIHTPAECKKTSKLALTEQVEALRSKTQDQFAAWTIDGALSALATEKNPLRLNFFSTAMRILFEHIMDSRSPEDQVVNANWFKPERPNGKPTRWQRVMFAIQGGLSETFVKDELKVDLPPLRKRLLGAVDELSKHVHGRANTIIRDEKEQEAVAKETVEAMNEFLDALRECRDAVLKPMTEALDRAAINLLLSETILEIDELATHHSVDEIYVDDIIVQAIGADSMTYRVTGSLGVTLQWGSNSDLRRGDGAEVEQSFPFSCEFQLPLDDPWDLDLAELSYEVDTGSWRDMRASDE
jgi:hypothetical protein